MFAMISDHAAVAIWRFRPKCSNPVRQWHQFHLSNRFEILHRARQYHCRDLCKISKRYACREKVMDKRDFTRFEFHMNYDRIFYVVTAPWFTKKECCRTYEEINSYLKWHMAKIILKLAKSLRHWNNRLHDLHIHCMVIIHQLTSRLWVVCQRD